MLKQGDLYDIEDFLHKFLKDFKKPRCNSKINYQSLVSSYIHKLNTTPYDIPVDTRDDKHYMRTIELDKSFYQIVWSVTAIDKLIKQMNLPVYSLDVHQMYSLVSLCGIEEKYVRKNENPIIIAEVPFMKQIFMPLDGNHRIVFKYRNNERFIDGYFLPFDVHIHAIISNYMKLIVMVHYNLCKIGIHAANPSIPDEALLKSLLKF